MCLLPQGYGGKVPLDGEEVESIDQIILKAAKQSINASDPFFMGVNEDTIRTEYDMLFTPQQWEEMQHPAGRQKRTGAVKQNRYRWPNSLVYYQLKRSDFGSRDVSEIYRAMNELSHYTCIRFEESSSVSNRVHITKGDGGCYSYVGMIGGKQELGLSKGCRSKHIILHELVHAIGVTHEQNRPDRDDHLKIHFDRILDHTENNFKKYSWRQMNTFGYPYDYLSVMHYGPESFAENTGDITMETRDPKYRDVIGTAPGLSLLDIRTLNSMYSCVSDDCQNQDCGPDGFVGKDCKCWCPGPSQAHPVKYCEQKDTDTNGSLDWNYECRDTNINCAYWASIGYCTEHIDYMMYHCEHTCNHCT